ncbi:hypothetical protein ACKI1O_50325, partial [Streptomyces scabiei]
DPACNPDLRLRSAREKCRNGTRSPQDDGDPEDCDQRDHQEVGQLIAETPTLTVWGAHDRKDSVTMTPETRPMSNISDR